MKNADIFVSRVWKAAILAAIMFFMFGRNPGFALTVSTDGSTITPSSGGSLETADGIWTFGSGPDSWGDWQLLLNGNEVGIGLEMEVDNAGQLYMADATGPSDWWVWQNNSWSPSTAPSPPPTGHSPDGSAITPALRGSLVTSNGTWTFGSGPDSWGDWQLLLNGKMVGIGLEMEVDNGGQLYMADVTGPSDWWVWQNNSWSQSSDPSGSGAVNGQCGPSNGIISNTPRNTGLCSAGTASPLTGNGPWNWTCSGSNGGSAVYCSASPPAPPPPTSCNLGNHGQSRGWARVSNGTLVADDGCLLQMAYSNERDTLSAYQDLHDNGHYNTIRYAIFLGQWYNDSQPGQSIADIENQLDNVISLAQQTGMYVLVDNHNTLPDPTGSGFGCPDWSADVAIWSAVAPRYANNSNVIYQIQNEPDWCGSENYSDIARNEDQLYQLIRSYAPNTPIFAWTFLNPLWVSNAGLQAVLAQAPDINYSNATVDFHAYSAGSGDITNFVNEARSVGPVTMSEYGVCVGSSWDTVLSTLQSLGVDWSCGDGYPDGNSAFTETWPED